MTGFLDESTRSRPEVVTSEYASGYVDPLQPLAPSGRLAILVPGRQSGKRRGRRFGVGQLPEPLAPSSCGARLRSGQPGISKRDLGQEM